MDQVTWKAFGRDWKVFLSLSDLFEGNLEHFQGRLEGDANARVSFSLMVNDDGTFKVHAMLLLDNETFWLAPAINASFDLMMYK